MSAGMGRVEWGLFLLVALVAVALVVVLLVLARRRGRWAKHAGGNGLWENLTPNEQRAVLAAPVVPGEGGGLWTHAAALAGDVDDAVYTSVGEVPGASLDADYGYALAAGGRVTAGTTPAAGRDGVVRALDGEVFVPLIVQDGTPLARLARSVGLTLPSDEQLQANVTRLAAATGVGVDEIARVLDETAEAMAEHGMTSAVVPPEVWREASDRVEACYLPPRSRLIDVTGLAERERHFLVKAADGTVTGPVTETELSTSPVYQLEALVRVAEQLAALDDDEHEARIDELALLAARTLTPEQMTALVSLRASLWAVC